MKLKNRLHTPLITTTEPSQSTGGIANNETSIDEYESQQRYRSFDTFIGNKHTENESHDNSTSSTSNAHKAEYLQESKLLDVFVTTLLLNLGAIIIILSIIAHQNQFNHILYLSLSNMILLTSFGSCIVFCSVWKLITIYCHCSCYNNISILYIFIIISSIISFILSIISFLNDSISYPLWLNISLLSYTCVVIITLIIIQLLPPNHFAHIHTSLPIEPTHVNAPVYIHNYGTLHPYDRSLLKHIWHSFTHQWVWNIIKLGYNQPLQVHDCYAVPKRDHIAAQYTVWEHYLNTVDFKSNKFSVFKCLWQLEGRYFIARCVVYMTALIASLSVPFLISGLSDFYEDKSIATSVGIYLSLALWTAAFLRIEIVSFIMTMTSRVLSRCRAMLIYVIYRKAI